MLYLRSYIPPTLPFSSVHDNSSNSQSPHSSHIQPKIHPDTPTDMPQMYHPHLQPAKVAPTPSTQAVRAVNRMFADTVRNDWVFPPPKPELAASAAGFAGAQASIANAPSLGSRINPFLEAKDADPLTYRERYYSTSDDEEMSSMLDEDMEEGEEFEESEDEEDEDEEETGEESKNWESEEMKTSSDSTTKDSDDRNEMPQLPTTPKPKRRSARFETPDSVADYVGRRLQAMKRRKRRLLEEEIQWNEGLCFFQRRRNAWTAAVSPEEAKSKMEAKETFTLGAAEIEAVSMSGLSLGYTPSAQPTPVTEEPPPPYPTHLLDAETSNAVSLDVKMKPGEEEKEADSPFKPPIDIKTLTNILLPISSPILPDSHPVRANILSRTDQELYEKLVRDSRTPAVPINLAHMMRVIVQGWKDEGNWPPRSALPEPSLAVAKRARGVLSGVLPDGSLNGTGGSPTTSGKEAINAGKGFMANHPHLKQGMESFKRVLRISSGGSAVERAGTPSASAGGLGSGASTPVEGKNRRSISLTQSKNSLDGGSGVGSGVAGT